uniref:Uncharacterized protein n=1 Tax=Haptolina brevifila TaxID=156173 RepID=A0A7S2H438_9EUKA|mmetsp:Transcript_51026/g.101519  ORF Transcript_51026/g.101519 Transcript_51026/m.101519 type:complete len:173 (+) Transcript_51026:137-655(+)
MNFAAAEPAVTHSGLEYMRDQPAAPAPAAAPALTADSVWPEHARIAALPFGGSLREAILQNDRAAVRAIQRFWGMTVLASDEQIESIVAAAASADWTPPPQLSMAPPAVPTPAAGDEAARIQSDSDFARRLQEEEFGQGNGNGEVLIDLPTGPPPVFRSDSDLARELSLQTV